MRVSVAYNEQIRSAWIPIQVTEDINVQQAIEQSGILQRFPDIDLNKQRVGIFGKLVKLDTPLHDGDRVEIYRQIIKVQDDDDDDDDD
ncbi:RnfH family protein [Gynuella sp.]|uniref:RnfH family protein n=1 Tax=Gynuella sp. TaxID=2969146 RepID=UPI003D0CD6B9